VKKKPPAPSAPSARTRGARLAVALAWAFSLSMPVSAVASGAGATPPAAPQDPMERLRDRLVEKLAAVKSSPPGDPQSMDLRVSAPAGPGPDGAGARSSLRRSADRTDKAARATGHWSYSGDVGPQAWGGLKPEFALCGNGQRQSPIDIREGIAVDLEPVKFDYQANPFTVVDNGHTVQVNVPPGSAIEVSGRRFELKQFHFHRPSEERIDGRQFEMSAHLVHQDSEGRLAVVAVLLAKGPAHPVVQAAWSNLPLEKHSEQRARATLDPAALLPADARYYTYMGSLTTPPCSEGVLWVVMRSPVTASPEQIEVFSRLYPMNARPPQSAAGRRIMQSN
jgi:carbonic anhydrase